MVKTLKARYFPNFDFLSSKMGCNFSFLWKSLLWAKELVQADLCWRIEDGKNIFVYKDNRIPKPVSFKHVSPKTLPIENTVSELINSNESWNIPLI